MLTVQQPSYPQNTSLGAIGQPFVSNGQATTMQGKLPSGGGLNQLQCWPNPYMQPAYQNPVLQTIQCMLEMVRGLLGSLMDMLRQLGGGIPTMRPFSNGLGQQPSIIPFLKSSTTGVPLDTGRGATGGIVDTLINKAGSWIGDKLGGLFTSGSSTAGSSGLLNTIAGVGGKVVDGLASGFGKVASFIGGLF